MEGVDLVSRFVEVLVIVRSSLDVDSILNSKVGHLVLLSLSLLKVLNSFQKKTLLFNDIGLCNGQTHLQQSVLVHVVIIFLLEELLIGLDLRLGRWEFTSLL